MFLVLGAISAAAPSPPDSVPFASQYQPALPGWKYEFPRDHASHPEFQTEWWYYTGHLGAKGRAGPRATDLLTRRETEVLRLLAEGLTNRQIAERLFISPKTAEHHTSRVYAKLGVSSRAEAAAYAARNLGAE